MREVDCLPAELRGAATKIERIAAGASGAGVYRVDAGGQIYVLKIASDDEPIASWRRRRHVQQLAADAGLAPRVLHVDEARRSVVSAFVADHSFIAYLMNPATHATAIALLGHTLRRLHELPLPGDLDVTDPHAQLAERIALVAVGFAPPFVVAAVERVLAEPPPVSDRPLVVSHNDVNPTNLTYDGERLVLLDWDVTGANDPLYDLASIAVFLRMDDATCRELLAAHDAAPIAELPARFIYLRRLVAMLAGVTGLVLARRTGHPGATGETLESAPVLLDVYQRLRSRAIDLATPDGMCQFGLALVKYAITDCS